MWKTTLQVIGVVLTCMALSYCMAVVLSEPEPGYDVLWMPVP